MNVYYEISFIGFFIVALCLGVNGIVYLFRTQIMSYHQQAMEMDWSDMPKGMQIMVLSFMKSAAAGMIATCIAMMAVLYIPFRQRELWSIITLGIIALCELGLITSRVYLVRYHTKGKPPFLFPAVLCILLVISIIFAFIA